MPNKLIDYIKPTIFPDNIISGVTTKSLDSYPDLGFSINKAEILDDNQTLENRKTLAAQLGVSFDKMLFQKQTHSDIIEVKDFDKTPYESDAMMIKESGFVLNVSIADCAAILIYDPENKAIAGIHSGWRGTQQNIVEKTIKMMFLKYKTNPSSVIAYISPAAGGDIYEVGEDVAHFFKIGITKISAQKYLLDNKFIIQNQLLDLGVRQHHIEVSPLCTISETKLHSYRRDRDKSGRMSAFIMIK